MTELLDFQHCNVAVNANQANAVPSDRVPDMVTKLVSRLASSRRIQVLVRVLAIIVVMVLQGGSALPARVETRRQFATVVSGWGFNLFTWELNALREKLTLFARVPPIDITDSRHSQLVLAYLERAQQMAQIERQLLELATDPASSSDDLTEEMTHLQIQLVELRTDQQAVRLKVELIIQAQISYQLRNAGFGFAGRPIPPVFFTFTEPPKTFIVSPRERIATVYSRMLDAEIDLQGIEAAEDSVRERLGASAYITEIGGLGAYPTMVVDRAGLQWILSTVAHEWVHNYLTFFPLGWNYFSSQDMTTINETVAEIVGNEIGAQALLAYYPDLEPMPLPTNEVDPVPEPVFDFVAEMRKTRLKVDRLLAEGQVVEAERYMERRRQVFIDHGYPLRVLNQAYFAFHGSYGTSGASSSPIAPMLFDLRQSMPSLRDFLQTVRWFTSAGDLERALGTRTGGVQPMMGQVLLPLCGHFVSETGAGRAIGVGK